MALSSILALALACGAPAPPPPAVAVAVALPQTSYDELLREFDDAVNAWREAYREADRDERKKLRDQDPTEVFWSRFVAAGEAGEGRALLWQVENVRRSGLARSEREARVDALFSELVDEHREAGWFADAIDSLARRARRDDGALELLTRVATDTEHRDNRANAMVRLGGQMLDAEDAAAHARGKALLEEVRESFEGSPWAEEAYRLLMAENLEPGKLAPDFTARTIEEHELALSDYRGKVVLLDFYGFW